MKKNLLFLLLLLSVTVYSQTDTSIVKFLNPASVYPPKGYSHAAEIDLGNCKMVIISGQVALDSKGTLVGKDDLARQADQVFLNIKNIVSASGGTMDNIVKIGIYMTDVSKVQAFRDIRNKYINLQAPPTSTLVQVSSLFRDDILIEIDATAIIPKK